MGKFWTGERLETDVFKETAIEHLHRYSVCFEFIKDKVVLDIASGEGYGSKLLAKNAKKVIGVDIDPDVILLARAKYQKDNLDFKIGRADAFPIETNSIDVVISFETLEHHDKHDDMFTEIKRVLKPGGLLIMSTPEKKVYSDIRNYKNPYHVKELYQEEFQSLVSKYFKKSKIYLQNSFRGSLIMPVKIGSLGYEHYQGDFSDIIKDRIFIPKYVIAFASDNQIIEWNDFSCFNGFDYSLKEYEREIYEAKLHEKYITEKSIKNSWDFKVGYHLLRPLKFIRSIFRNK